MMAADISRALDPVLLAQDAGVTLDDWQAAFISNIPRRAILNCSRQGGKSTAVALAALHTALFQPGALVVIFSPTQRQSSMLNRKILKYHHRLSGVPRIRMENSQRVEFDNSSQCLVMPGTEKTVRGISGPDMLIIDEAARVEDPLFFACAPMLSTKPNGKFILLSTPAGRRGEFFRLYHEAGNDWHRVRVPATDCPRITQAHLDEQLRDLGPAQFAAEYLCEFVDHNVSAFTNHTIEGAFSSSVRPLWAA